MSKKHYTPISSLQEFTRGLASPTVDREAGIVKGVKVLGKSSANGREYSAQAMAGAQKLYEGARVNINHSASPTAPRDYRDRFGHLANVSMREDGLYADLHYNPKHAMAEQFAWDAEHAPQNVGLSHNAEGRVGKQNGRNVVEEIIRVRSVDVVGDPATNKSLYESEQPMDAVPELGGGGVADVRSMIHQGIDKILDGDGDAATKAASIKRLVGELLKVEEKIDAAMNGKAEPPPEEKPAETTEQKQEQPNAELAQLREQLAGYVAKEAKAKAEAEARTLLEAERCEARPEWIAAVVALEESRRAEFVKSLPKRSFFESPRSSSPLVEQKDTTTPTQDAKAFAAALLN